MAHTPEADAFRRAAEIFGGITALSHWLKVPADCVRKWISGEEVPPRAIYLQVADTLHSADKQHCGTADTPQAAGVVNTPGVGLGLRVLIADHDRDTLMTLGILLRSEGFDVRLLGDAAQLDGAVREFRPHAVLLDLAMPGRSGYDIAKDLTRQYAAARPVLVAISAQSGDSARRAAESGGFDHHLSRPYNPEALLALLAALKRR